MNKFELNTFLLNKWFYKNFNSTINNKNNIDILSPSLDFFIHSVINPLLDKGLIESNMKLNIIVKAKHENLTRSITPLQTLQVSDINQLKDILIGFYTTFHEENYNQIEFNEVIFNFRVLSGDFLPLAKNKVLKVEDHIKFKIKAYDHKISNVNLPLNMDLYLWGEISFLNEYNKATLQIYNLIYNFNLAEDSYICEVKTLEGQRIIKFKDTILDKYDLYHFKREIYGLNSNIEEVNRLFIFKDNNIIAKGKKHNPPVIPKVSKAYQISNKIIAMDIETKANNGKMDAVCISLFDGKSLKSFFISDFKNSEDLIIESIKYLNRPKYSGFKIYFHNFALFDSVFIVKRLRKLGTLDLKVRDGVLIEIKCKFSDKVKLTFRDSYLLLPSSLDSLGKNLIGINESKELFPYEFLNQSDLSYKGVIPDLTYFNNVSEEDYQEYKEQFKTNEWDLKAETIKYCESDVMLLHNVLRKFSLTIFRHFKMDIFKYPTLPSLAFAIYRASYLKEGWNISILDGEIYKFISNAYTGGHVDLYHHQNKPDEKVYRYDVNSLYPFVMLNDPMPVGNPIQFEGDILDKKIFNEFAKTFKLEEKFGFFEANIETPSSLNAPILLKRMKFKDIGFRTVAPLGKWTGVYHSEELSNSEKYGYNYTVNKGYLFNRQIIFKEYITFLYELKKNSSNGTPDYLISKLLMNSLYGRFGMTPDNLNTAILSNLEIDFLIQSNEEYHIYDKTDLDDDFSIITFRKIDDEQTDANVNVSIAASITAGGRLHMSNFKNMPGYKLFYSDTDSIDLDKPLAEEFVGKEIGEMKLEHVWEKAVYISNKAYIGVDKEGEIYRRIRGVKVNSSEFRNNPIDYSDMEKLLDKESFIKVPQVRWFRSYKEGKILIKDTTYKLEGNDNKRISIYENGKKSYTNPMIIDETTK